jgi:hypothetical protein
MNMAIQIKPIDKIVAKWKAKAGGASADYSDGINFPKRDPGQAASAAADVWLQGVTAPDAKTSFAKNAADSTPKWKKNAIAVGGSRYTQGVANAADEFSKGIGPALSVIAGLNLPPRQPKGSAGNLERVRIVNEALRKMKVGG